MGVSVDRAGVSAAVKGERLEVSLRNDLVERDSVDGVAGAWVVCSELDGDVVDPRAKRLYGQPLGVAIASLLTIFDVEDALRAIGGVNGKVHPIFIIVLVTHDETILGGHSCLSEGLFDRLCDQIYNI